MNFIFGSFLGKLCLLLCIVLEISVFSQSYEYHWEDAQAADSTALVLQIEPPPGFERLPAPRNSFRQWLRHLPLKKKNRKIHLYNGRLKGNQKAHFRIIDIDVGSSDLQQCADAVIRLRAEYLFSRKRFADIRFNFTSGHEAGLVQWQRGFRPHVTGNRVSWRKTAFADTGYQNFRKYLNTVFMYAGSYSLSREMIPVSRLSEAKIGDVFIQGGFPGHAVMIVDMARKQGKTAILLSQSYMPAQEIHILKNPRNHKMNPWYILGEGNKLYTPEWTFEWAALKRFKGEQ